MSAARPQAPLWVGDYIRWWGGTDWEWIACVKCGRPLSTDKSRRDGFGPDCAAEVTPAILEEIKASEHAACRLALEVHRQAQTTKPDWRNHQAYLRRQRERRLRGQT